jgi:hypothetical protein
MAQYEIHLDSSKAKSYNANPIWIRQDDAQDTIKVFCGNDLNVSENSKFEFDSTKFDKNIIKDTTAANFKYFSDATTNQKGFIYTLPKEMYTSSGTTTATYFKVDGTSTTNFIIQVLRADGVSDSNSYISASNDILDQMASTYETLQEVLKNADVDTETINVQIAELRKNLADIEQLIDDNDVIKKSEAQEVITGIVNEMDLDTDDKISDPDVLAKIQTLGAV